MWMKSKNNKMAFGVIAGIAQDTKMDISALRLLTVVVGLFTGVLPVAICYLVLAAVMQEEE